MQNGIVRNGRDARNDVPQPAGYPLQVEPFVGQPQAFDIRRSVTQVLDVVRRGKWLIAGVFAVVLILAVVYTAILPREYSSYTVLLVDEAKPTARVDDALALGYVGTGRLSADGSTQALILSQSLEIAERTVDRLRQLAVLPSTGDTLSLFKAPPKPGFIASLLGRQADPRPVTDMDLAVRLQEEFIHIGSEGRSITITSSGPIAEETALMANTYAEEYTKLARESSRARIVASREFLEEQIDAREGELETLERDIRDYLSRRDAVALDEGARLTVAQYVQLEAQRDQANVDLASRLARVEQLERNLEQVRPGLVESMAAGTSAELRQKQERVAQLEQTLEQIYVANPGLRQDTADPDLQRLRRQAEEARARVRELSQQYVDNVAATGESGGAAGAAPAGGEGTAAAGGGGASYVAQLTREIAKERAAISGVEAQISALNVNLGDANRKLQRIPSQSMQLAQLERSRMLAEQSYTYLASNLQEVRIAEESEIGQARVIRPARVPEKPVRPNRGRNYVLGALMGLMLGLVTAIGRHKLDSRIYSPEDLEASDMGILGVIPDLQPTIKQDFNDEERFVIRDRAFRTTLIPFLNPLSPVADAYRRLYINMQMLLPKQGGQSVLVTSSEPEAGKSTTALNLAITAAAAGKRTIIIDADLHRPILHEYLDWKSGRSLNELITQSRPHVDKRWFETGIENLYAITSPVPVDNATKRLGSKEMQRIMTRLKDYFDVVIYDTPPVLMKTDATQLAPNCDATVVVVAAGNTDADAHKHVLSELQTNGGRVIGTVLNRYAPKTMLGYKNPYTYSYALDYGYGYRRKLEA
ncbi:MAG: polysaccharide biosynthesis tyrosine autokinase [Bacteroidota bacterium]